MTNATEILQPIMFFDDFNFSKLIQPVEKKAFFEDYFGKKSLLIKRQNTSFYQDLLTPAHLDDILFRWPNDATLVKADKNDGNRQNLYAGVTQTSTPTILSELDQGSTLILDKLDNRLPNLTELNGRLETELHYSHQANIYVTPPQSKGFRPHFDDHHVFILQTTGKKYWRVDNNTQPTNTPKDKATDLAINEADHQAFMLEQGDLIYIPPYTVHEAISQDEYSVHITLSPYPPSWRQLINHIIQTQAQAGSDIDKPLPPAYLDSNAADLLKVVKNQLTQTASSLNQDVVESFKKEQADSFRGVFFGALENRMRAPEISATSRFKPNRALLIQKQLRGDDIAIKTPKKEVLLPALFEPQIEFCLTQAAFSVDAIPDMNFDESVVLATRLLTEGLIIPAE